MSLKYFFLLLTLSALFFAPADVSAHAGHDHSEETPTVSITQEQASPETKVLQKNTEEETTHATPLWIPVAAVAGGIAVGGLGVFLLHTRLHPKKKE